MAALQFGEMRGPRRSLVGVSEAFEIGREWQNVTVITLGSGGPWGTCYLAGAVASFVLWRTTSQLYDLTALASITRIYARSVKLGSILVFATFRSSLF